MKLELDERLCREFPLLYIDRSESEMKTCMHRGFECGDGWFNLLYDMSMKLEAHLKEMPASERFKAVQVKEKFGSLSVCLSGYDEVTEKIIREAEVVANRTCEKCGNPGVPMEARWDHVFCNACFVNDESRCGG